jgi:hypothetical protein
VRFAAVHPGHPLQVCARREGYRPACSERFTLDADEQHSVTLTLAKEGVLRGRVEPAGHFDHAMLFWVAPTGHITEEISIATSGTFSYTRPHAPVEYAVIASTTRPLYVITEWSVVDDEIVLRVPQVATRTFRVHAPADDYPTHFVGLTVSGRKVPLNALVFHLTNRRTWHLVHRAAPLVIADVAASGPITVLLGPSPQQLPPGTPPEEVFLRPELAPLVRELPVPAGTNEIAF